MMESMVDYVLERGNQHFGEFSHKGDGDPKSVMFNHRKLLEYLFQDNETSSRIQNQKRISDLKYEQISGQLNYFSEKLHGELNKKYLEIDSDLYRLENEWLRKKIPDFYSYYFLKFAYANTYSRMHELFLSELEHMSRQKDSYIIIKRTIEAREVCIANLRRDLSSVSDLDIQESLETLRAERELKKKKAIERQQKGYKKKNKDEADEEIGKSWKNKLELIFESISHLRKLTCYVVELIKNWKNSIYNISEDPRRFRERVIFFHFDANYLLKTIFDTKFVTSSFLKKYLTFASHYDPFLLRPGMVFQNKGPKMTENQSIFYELVKPTDQQLDKMTRALVILAEQQYDEDEQSKFLTQRQNYGSLQNRKKFIEKRREMFATKSQSNLKKGTQTEKQKIKDAEFKNDKKSDLSKVENEKNEQEKAEKLSKSRIDSSLNRVKKIRSVDLKKISPYLSRNQRIAKAQKVIELQHKFRVAQNQYIEEVKEKKEKQTKEHNPRKKAELKKEWEAPQHEIVNNKIFNRYIEENLKLLDQANRKAFIYKNKVSPKKSQSVARDLNYNKVSFRDRKQAQYQRNLQQYQTDQRIFTQSQRDLRSSVRKSSQNDRNQPKTKGTKAIIEISDKGVRNNQKIVDYELSGRKGKNVGKILQNKQHQQEMRLIEQKLNPTVNKSRVQQKRDRQRFESQQQKQNLNGNNLYESEQKPEIIIMRQEPQKIEEIKQYLYAKIKEELIEEMKKNAEDKELELNKMIEQEKRRKLDEIIEQRRLQEIKRKEEEERLRLQQLERERKKMDFQVRVQPIQYSEQNVGQFFDKVFGIDPQIYHRMYLNEKLQQKKQTLMDQFYMIFLRGFLDNEEMAYAIAKYDWACQTSRKIIFEYVNVKNFYHFISSFHQFCEYFWKNDPVDHIEIVVYNNLENTEGTKVILDLQEYANRRGETFERNLYSNVTELKFVWARPTEYQNIQFPYSGYYFGSKFNLKCQLLSSAFSLNERMTPKIDMNLEVYTNYIFLLEELFRRYLTPEEVIQLRESSTNIRRLKDIFRIVLELEKTNPIVDELTIVEGLNLDDLYDKLKDKLSPPYDRYYWHHFYDRTIQNRILLSILQFSLNLQFPINSAMLDDRRFLRINPRRKVLVLKSSVYSRQNIYVLNTDNKKIRMFLMDAQHYKLMRIQLFVFLNLVFNNIVEDKEVYVNSFWVPQFVINNNCHTEKGAKPEKTAKQVKRITDFSISMKKSFFCSEQIYYSNNQYIKNALSFLPKKSDVIYKQAMIVGFLHTAVENGSTGMPIYSKMIDRTETFDA